MRFLFIEDEINARKGLTIILEKNKHRVDHAGSVKEAVELMSKHKYDVLILDIMIPNDYFSPQISFTEAGIELYKQLRQGTLKSIQTSKDVLIVAITAVSNIMTLMEMVNSDSTEVIPKPIDPYEAFDKINKLIRSNDKI